MILHWNADLDWISHCDLCFLGGVALPLVNGLDFPAAATAASELRGPRRCFRVRASWNMIQQPASRKHVARCTFCVPRN
eukprot:s4134_g4.t1